MSLKTKVGHDGSKNWNTWIESELTRYSDVMRNKLIDIKRGTDWYVDFFHVRSLIITVYPIPTSAPIFHDKC